MGSYEGNRDRLFARSLARSLVYVVAVSGGCGLPPGGEAAREDGEKGAATAAVTTTVLPATCGTTKAALDFSGSAVGSALTPGTSICPAFIASVNSYAATNDHGTSVAYNGPIPTSKADCEATSLTVGVWECFSGAISSACTTSNRHVARGQATSRGLWLADPTGQGVCRLPRMMVEQRVPTYRPGGRSFKLAMQARNAAGAQRADWATTKIKEDDVYASDAVQREIQAQTGGTIAPSVHRAWNAFHESSLRDRACRSAALEQTFLSFASKALVQAGASALDISLRTSAYSRMTAALCSGGTEAAFQTATADFLVRDLAIRNALATRYGAQAAILGNGWADPQAFAVMLEGQIAEQAMGSLVSNCDLNIPNLYGYLLNGTLPAAATADSLLLGNCGSTPALAASSLRLGQARTASAARTELASCFAPNNTNVCNDPRAQGAPTDDGSIPPGSDGDDDSETPPSECFIDDPNGQGCAFDQTVEVTIEVDRHKEAMEWLEAINQRVVDDALAESAQRGLTAGNRAEATAAVDQFVHQKPGVVRRVLFGMGTILYGTALNAGVKAGAGALLASGTISAGVAASIVLWAPIGIAVVGLTANELFKEGFFDKRNWKDGHFVPWRDGKWWYCPAAFAPGGWYGAHDGRFTDGSPPREINQQDQLEHCLCQALDTVYASDTLQARQVGSGLNFSLVKASTMCPTKTERTAQECLRNPQGPTDAPKPECFNILEPARIDNSEWLNRACNVLRCADPNTQRSVVVGGDHCGCIPRFIFEDPNVLECERRGWAAYCTDEQGANCLCGTQGYGVLPYNDPSCVQDPRTFPGSLERVVTQNPDRLSVVIDPAASSDRLLAYRMSGASRVSAVLPGYRVNTLPAVGLGLTARTLVTSTATSGTLQLYLNNAPAGVNRELVAQCDLRSLTAGQTGTCNFIPPLAGGRQRQMWNACFASGTCTPEVAVAGLQAGFNGTVAFGSPAFTIAPVTPSGTTPPAACPASPFGERFHLIANPLWIDAGGTPQSPLVSLVLGDGATTLVRPTISVIDPEFTPVFSILP